MTRTQRAHSKIVMSKGKNERLNKYKRWWCDGRWREPTTSSLLIIIMFLFLSIFGRCHSVRRSFIPLNHHHHHFDAFWRPIQLNPQDAFSFIRRFHSTVRGKSSENYFENVSRYLPSYGSWKTQQELFPYGYDNDVFINTTDNNLSIKKSVLSVSEGESVRFHWAQMTSTFVDFLDFST